MKNVDHTLIFESRPRIISSAAVVGKKEAEGPLREDFDRIIYDSYAAQPTFEQAEMELVRTAAGLAMEKAELRNRDIDVAFCGDLLNQCVATGFGMSGLGIPYAGIYSACSTMALGLLLSAVAVEGGAAVRALCGASSHYCTAERQYRFPLEYGSQRPPTSQWTVTGAGMCLLERDSDHCDSAGADDGFRSTEDSVSCVLPNTDKPYIHAARPGIITDYGITDQNNMGAAMAPANVK